MGHQTLAAVLLIITGEDQLVIRGILHRNQHIGQGAVEVEVEGEEEALAAKDDGLFRRFQKTQVRHALGEHAVLFGQSHHILVKITQPLVFEIFVVPQAPLAAAVMEAPAVAFTGEVDPLRVAKLVAHEVEVGLAAATQGEQADHLVQGDGAVNDGVVAVLVHVGVHGGVCQAEDHGLVSHQRLVVAFHVGHRILTGTAQAHIAPHLADVPEFVLLLLHRTDPHIGKTHGQTIVKADAAVFDGQAHTRHTGHILGDGDGIGIHFPDQLVGQLQVGDGLGVGVEGEILGVIIKAGAKAVVMIEHGGDAVEAEAVEMVLRHPEGQVAQQEMQDLILAVVEALGAPGGMVALGTGVEELPLGAVEHIDALSGIFHSMRVDHVQQHPNAQLMGLVHQVLQVLGFPKPTGSGKEVCHLVAKASVIGMLHDGHELDGVVAGLLDTGKDLVSKFPVGTYLTLLLGHAHMGLVDVEGLGGLKVPVCPGIGIPVIHHFCGESRGLGVLDYAAGVERDMLRTGHVDVHHGFDLTALPKGVVPLQHQLPHTVIKTLHGMRGLVPAVKIAGKVELIGTGSPLAVDPGAIEMVDAEIMMGIGKILQSAAAG